MRLRLLAPLLLALLPWHCLPAAAQTLNYPVAYAFSPALQPSQPAGQQCALPQQTCQSGCVDITIKADCSGISQLSTGDGPPPDTNAAVGDTQVVEFVNNSYQVFDKTTGAQLTQPIDDKDLFQSLPDDSACKVQDGGDIIVDWDKANHVWLLAYNIGSPIGPGNTYPLCVAVSTSADATSSYNVYQYSLGAYFADYPKWGLWPTGYFQTNDNTTYGPLVCAYNGAKMRAGDPTAEQICRRLAQSDFHLLPADADSPPPTGQDEFFIGSMGVQHEATCPGTGYSSLYLYSMHPVFSNPIQTTFTGIDLADPICVPSYLPYFTDNIPQEGTDNQLAAMGNASMYRFAYWNDGALYYGGMQHWHMNHTVQAAGGQAGVRWYEFEAIERPATLASVYLLQSGTFAPDSNYRWMGSIAQDKLGDIAVGYSESSSTMYPSIYVTGRVLTDPSGEMEGEVLLWPGSASQTDQCHNYQLGLCHRWGDYSSMAIDGSDGCTFWYAQEHIDAASPTYWSTRLISFAFNGCN